MKCEGTVYGIVSSLLRCDDDDTLSYWPPLVPLTSDKSIEIEDFKYKIAK